MMINHGTIFYHKPFFLLVYYKMTIYTLYIKVSNIYRHITYIGSITTSSLIGILCLLLNTPHSPVGYAIWNMAVLKSFFLYDSTLPEYIHHLVMLFFLYHNNPYTNTFNIESPNTIYYVRLGYATFFTSVFSNLQIYLKPSKYKYVFKYLNYAIFIIFRYQFNKAIWNFRNFNILFSYYNNDLTKIYVSYSCMFLISLFNVLWTYIMLRNIHRKLIKSQ